MDAGQHPVVSDTYNQAWDLGSTAGSRFPLKRLARAETNVYGQG